jgi:hypothetical protein
MSTIVAFGEDDKFYTGCPNGQSYWTHLSDGLQRVLDGDNHKYIWVSMGPSEQYYCGRMLNSSPYQHLPRCTLSYIRPRHTYIQSRFYLFINYNKCPNHPKRHASRYYHTINESKFIPYIITAIRHI